MEDWEDSQVVVGIDFGTTYSGVAWIQGGGMQDIRVIKDWPNPLALNANADKVPSVISYKNGKVKDWGYDVNVQDASIKWFKVLLEAHPKCPLNTDAVKQSNALLEQMNKTAEDVVADYLQALWNYAKEDIRKRVDDVLWESTKRVVLTVPAVWSDSAKDKTLKAAKRAGLGDAITLVSEPEAAALATLKEKAKHNNLKAGDAFVVCDAGGGTVDLISYKIINTDPLRIEECAVGDGDLCGSVFLDIAFERYIITITGEGQYMSIKERHRKKMLHCFEAGVKRAFTGDPRKEFTVDLPGVEDDHENGICDDTIILRPYVILHLSGPSRSAIQTVFDHVCGRIETLVQRQIQSVSEKNLKIKAILLVGGFGESKYLHKRLETSYESADIRVMQVPGAWSSICRGAALWGTLQSRRPKAPSFSDSDSGIAIPSFNPFISSRLARGSYGVAISFPFDESRHSWQDRYFDQADGMWMAKNQMRWLLRRGEEITEGKVVPTDVSRNVADLRWNSDGVRSFTTDLFYCDSEVPPMRLDSTVRQLCQVTYVISEARLYNQGIKFKSKIDKEKYRRCHFIFSIYLNSVDLSFEVWFNGEAVGSVDASYVDS